MKRKTSKDDLKKSHYGSERNVYKKSVNGEEFSDESFFVSVSLDTLRGWVEIETV